MKDFIKSVLYRASLGAAVALLQDAAALSDGSVPLAPLPSAPSASAKMTAPGRSHSSYDSSDSDLAEAGGESVEAANGLASTRALVNFELWKILVSRESYNDLGNAGHQSAAQ